MMNLGYTKIILDKERHLRLDLNAMCLFEEITGKSLINANAAIDLQSAVNIRALLYACLKHEDPNLTLEQVGAMIHPGNMEYLADQLIRAYGQAMPEETETTEDDAPLVKTAQS